MCTALATALALLASRGHRVAVPTVLMIKLVPFHGFSIPVAYPSVNENPPETWSGRA